MKKNLNAKKIKLPIWEETLRTFSKTNDVEQLKTINRSLHRLNESYLSLLEMQAKYIASMAKQITELRGEPEQPELPESKNNVKLDYELSYPGLN
jgi:hypothetical protein